jgi:hypothetical protein
MGASLLGLMRLISRCPSGFCALSWNGGKFSARGVLADASRVDANEVPQ